MEKKNLKSILESLLFVAGKPISMKKLAHISGAEQNLIYELIKELDRDYSNSRGLQIIFKGDKVQMVSAADNARYVNKLLTEEVQGDLSKATLETLAIIAYRGPLSRLAIEEIRGVNSIYILRNLLMRGLIDKKRSKKDARTMVYEVSFDFLRHLGLKSIKDLPDYQRLKQEEKR